MLLQLPINILIVLIPILVFSLCFHEFSHGYMAFKLGDKTAEKEGRITLNPLAHLDPIGSIMILFIGFGWAKPVPVNPSNLTDPRLDMIKIAFAGPASNIFLALLSGIIIKLLLILSLIDNNLLTILLTFAQVNIALAIFNLLPIAPLDGSQILGNILSKSNPELAWKLQTYGPKILLILILISYVTKFSIFGLIISPFTELFIKVFINI